MTTANEILGERPDYEGTSPTQRAMRRFLEIMAHEASKRLTGTVVMADPRHNLFLNYDEMRPLSTCPQLPAGFTFLSTDPDSVRGMISGPKNRAAITREYGLCWRGEHLTGPEGEVVYGIEWTLNLWNGAAWAGARHLDREISSAHGHEQELEEIGRRAPLAAKNLFKKLGEHAGARLERLMSAREEHRTLLGAGDQTETLSASHE